VLVDSHCHLDFPDFAGDREAVLTRARAHGVGAMLTISTHLSRFDQVRALAERHDEVFCTVGIHPHEAAAEAPASVDKLVELAAHPKVVAFGETGLDFYYEHSPRAEQERSFRAHIAAARITGLPVVIHTRDADAETARIIAEEMDKGPFAAVVHCFSGGQMLADAMLAHGFFISFAGIVTFRKADALREVASEVPLDHLLVETDAPFLAPVPRRGKRNEPAFVSYTAACIAALKGLSEPALAAATTANFFSLFTKASRPCG
jgi:TatD DNase family protein